MWYPARTIVLFLSIFLISAAALRARDIGGVTMPDKIKVEGRDLVLNGAGIREKFIFHIYAAGLYLEEKTSKEEEIIQARKLMAIRLHVLSGYINRERMAEATRRGFVKAAGNDLASIKDRVDRFIARMNKDEIGKNDIFQLVYVPDTGVKSYKNGRLLDTVQGFDFKKALFGIWLSQSPVQESLKKAMLGR